MYTLHSFFFFFTSPLTILYLELDNLKVFFELFLENCYKNLMKSIIEMIKLKLVKIVYNKERKKVKFVFFCLWEYL